MSSVLVLFGSGEGQTAEVAERVGGGLTAGGHDATVADVDASRDYEYTDWDAVDAFAADVSAFFDGRVDAA